MQVVQTPSLAVHTLASLLVVATFMQTPSMGAYPFLHLLQYFEPPSSAVHCPSAQFSAYLPVHSGMHVPAVELAVVRFSTDPGGSFLIPE